MALFFRPNADVTRNTWVTESAGTTTIYTSIDEVSASDADYIENDNNTNDAYTAGMTNPGSPANGTCTVRYRYSKSAAAGNSRNVQVSVQDSVGAIATGTLHSNISEAWTAGSFTFLVSAVNDWASIELVFTASGTTGGSPSGRRSVRISWAEIETPDPAAGPGRRVMIIS